MGHQINKHKGPKQSLTKNIELKLCFGSPINYVSRKLNSYSKREKTGVHNEMRYKDCKNLHLNSLSNEVSELNLNFNFQESNIELMCEQYFNQLSQLQNKYVIEKILRQK